jgi:FMN-dependent NADH-azoreductase
MLQEQITVADPSNVTHLAEALLDSLEEAADTNEITTSDVLSAIFTLLDHVLRMVGKDLTPEERDYNSKEVSRVLTDMLLEYGSTELPRN